MRDNGPGSADAVRQRMFEPFYTTKAEQDGTGLGLSITYGVIQRHGGHIEVESIQGQGTCIDVYLPLPESLSDGDGRVSHV